MKPYWTTAEGKQIPYPELETPHLLNIIKDGYRNPKILEEANRRGFNVPIRPVDKLSMGDHFIWLESFNSCAMSGNKFAERMAKLHDEDPELYLLTLNAYLEKNEP